MKKNIKIYLCGSIKKGSSDNEKKHYWGEKEELEIINSFGGQFEIILLNPATIGIKRNDSYSNFGADVFLVKNSDFIFVDARNKRGIGVGCEMIIAKYYGIPVVTLCPNETDYKKSFVEDLCGENVSNWIHPFVAGPSDFICDDIPSAVKWMIDHLDNPKHIKNIDILEESVEYFTSKQHIDLP